MIRTIMTDDQVQFERESNGLIEQGFILDSSSCNTYQYGDYRERTFWSAIFVKPTLVNVLKES